MFAVPGWSVSADALKAQTQSSLKALDKQPKAESNESTKQSGKVSKKRKRSSNNVDGVAITAGNFAELWEKHIEGKPMVKSKVDRNTLNGFTEVVGSTEIVGSIEVIGSTEVRSTAIGLAEANVKREKKKRKTEHKEDGKGGVENKSSSTKNLDAKVNGKDEYQKRKTLAAEKREKKALPQANGELSPTLLSTTKKLEPTNVQSKQDHKAPKALQTQDSQSSAPAPPPLPSNLTPLQSSMRQKLVSARFRYLNQTLYTTPSNLSYDLFTQNPTFFNEYHDGFQRQVNAWPENPVESFIRWVQQRGPMDLGGKVLGSQKASFKKNKNLQKSNPVIPNNPSGPAANDTTTSPLPRHPATHLCTIADLGCGTALFARTLSPLSKSLKLQIRSFDLCVPNPLVTIADIRALPLKDASVDVAIFCLALMGTNWLEFVEEAWRVLRWKGECWIGEVGSRFVTPRGIGKGRVGHSVGNRIKTTVVGKNGGKKGRGGTEEEDLAADDEDALETQPPSKYPSLASAQSTTNLTPFISVLHTRGFVLAGEPELGNKMFVRMRFIKALTPTRGKCVPELPKEAKRTKGIKFIENERGDDGEITVEDETRVLKGCVYKNR